MKKVCNSIFQQNYTLRCNGGNKGPYKQPEHDNKPQP